MQDLETSRLPLVENISSISDGLPDINLFRAAANARTLYPRFIQYVHQLFQPMELDSKVERLVVLYVAKLEGAEYIWRQNVVVARTLEIPQAQIDALGREEIDSTLFSDAQRAAFHFTNEAIAKIEVSDPTYAKASRHFGPQAITELLYVVGTYMMLARIARTGHVPLDKEPADPSKVKH